MQWKSFPPAIRHLITMDFSERLLNFFHDEETDVVKGVRSG